MFQILNRCLQTKNIIPIHHLPSFLTRCLCSQFIPYDRYQLFHFKSRCGIQLKVIKSSKSGERFRCTCLQKNRPSPRQRRPKNNLKTLPGPRPLLLTASTVAPAESSCSTTATRPLPAAKCSGLQPRAPGMQRRRQRQLRLPSRNITIVMGCFSGWLGKLWIGHRRSASRYSWCEAVGEKTRATIANQSCYMCVNRDLTSVVAPYFRHIMCRMYSVSCQWDVSPSGWVKF